MQPLCAFLFIRWCHHQRQQMPKRIDRHGDLTAFASFMPIIASPRSALRGRLKDASIKDRRARLSCTVGNFPQQLAQVMHQSFKNASFQPALRLLIDC